MQYAFIVRGGQAGADPAGDFQRLVGGQAADAAQQRAEVFAVDVLHRKVRLAFDFAEVVNAADIGMRDLAGDAHLVVETAASTAASFRSAAGRNLSAHMAEPEILGAIYFAHTAPAQQRDDPVPLD